MVLVHLSVSLFLVYVLVLGGLDKVNQPGCKVVAALLLYFLLVAFSWMLVEAVVHYMKFVKVFNPYTPKFSMKTALPSYSKNITFTFMMMSPNKTAWLS